MIKKRGKIHLIVNSFESWTLIIATLALLVIAIISSDDKTPQFITSLNLSDFFQQDWLFGTTSLALSTSTISSIIIYYTISYIPKKIKQSNTFNEIHVDLSSIISSVFNFTPDEAYTYITEIETCDISSNFPEEYRNIIFKDSLTSALNSLERNMLSFQYWTHKEHKKNDESLKHIEKIRNIIRTHSENTNGEKPNSWSLAAESRQYILLLTIQVSDLLHNKSMLDFK